jgi:hypothetical protein
MTRTSFKILGLFGVIAALAFLAVPADVLAQSLEQAVQKSRSSIANPIATLIAIFCYLIGGGFLVSSFFLFKQHANNPTAGNLSKGMITGLVSAGLLAAPFFIDLLTETGRDVSGSGGATRAADWKPF